MESLLDRLIFMKKINIRILVCDIQFCFLSSNKAPNFNVMLTKKILYLLCWQYACASRLEQPYRSNVN